MFWYHYTWYGKRFCYFATWKKRVEMSVGSGMQSCVKLRWLQACMCRGKTVVLGLLMTHALEISIHVFWFVLSIWIFRLFYNEYIDLTSAKQESSTSSISRSPGKGRKEGKKEGRKRREERRKERGKGRREGTKEGEKEGGEGGRRKGDCSKICFPWAALCMIPLGLEGPDVQDMSAH